MSDLSEIDRTQLLAARGTRAPDFGSENAALQRLAGALADPAGNVLDALAEVALELCAADSAGISLLEPGGPEPRVKK